MPFCFAQEKETERLVAEFEKQGIKVWLLDQWGSTYFAGGWDRAAGLDRAAGWDRPGEVGIGMQRWSVALHCPHWEVADLVVSALFPHLFQWRAAPAPLAVLLSRPLC